MWQYDRVLQFNPPDGEFVVMNYRITKEIVPPFRIQPFMEDAGPGRVDLIIKVRPECLLHRVALSWLPTADSM